MQISIETFQGVSEHFLKVSYFPIVRISVDLFAAYKGNALLLKFRLPGVVLPDAIVSDRSQIEKQNT